MSANKVAQYMYNGNILDKTEAEMQILMTRMPTEAHMELQTELMLDLQEYFEEQELAEIAEEDEELEAVEIWSEDEYDSGVGA